MARKPGRPRNQEILRWIPVILEERPLQNPQRIRERYRELTGRGVGYDTVKKALDHLVEQGVVTELKTGRGKIRKTRVYSLV